LEAFDGDGGELSTLGARLEPCLQERHQQPQDDRLSPWLWALPLALFLIAGTWMVSRAVDGYRMDAYVDRLRIEPGMVVTGVERHGWRWEISGLRDPLATDPGDLLAQAHLNPRRVTARWEPFQALNAAIVMKRFDASLSPPPTARLSLDGGTIRVDGSAPQYWVDRARAFIDTLPAGSPRVDLSGLTDVQDPTYIRLRDAIEAHVISFDSNAPRPASGQESVFDALAAELRDLIRVAKGLGFSVRVMIVGHTDSTGAEIANLALSAARAEVVRSMLRDRGIAPESLLVRSAGIFEPVKSTAGADDGINRRVTFTVSTAQ
jgi:outer membrane protein OmpA-like peptidoglycan-associated protein